LLARAGQAGRAAAVDGGGRQEVGRPGRAGQGNICFLVGVFGVLGLLGRLLLPNQHYFSADQRRSFVLLLIVHFLAFILFLGRLGLVAGLVLAEAA